VAAPAVALGEADGAAVEVCVAGELGVALGAVAVRDGAAVGDSEAALVTVAAGDVGAPGCAGAARARTSGR